MDFPTLNRKIAVVIPCYRVRAHVLGVLSEIGSEVSRIYVVDDKCPEGTGAFVEQACADPRITVIYNPDNRGVGGATIAGYRQALEDEMDIVVKVDGDGQMDPSFIPYLVTPLLQGRADYSKGNRFYSLGFLTSMPAVRIFGNAVLSFLSKASSGYWHLMDPTNGFTAIHCRALSMLPLDKLARRYFFESDMLFRLNTIRAVIIEMPMRARYEDEESSMSISKVSLEFPFRHAQCLLKRIFYGYFLRDFNICSLELVFGVLLTLFGVVFGLYHWHLGSIVGEVASTGTVMLAVLPIILGFQLLLAAVSYDAMNIPSDPLQRFAFAPPDSDSRSVKTAPRESANLS